MAPSYAGEMESMSKSAARRADIRNFLPSARSVIVTGTNYNADGRREPGSGNRSRMLFKSRIRADRIITSCWPSGCACYSAG